MGFFFYEEKFMYFYSFTNREHHDFRRAAHVIHTKMAIIGKPPDRGAQRTTPPAESLHFAGNASPATEFRRVVSKTKRKF